MLNIKNIKNEDRAVILTQALPYIKKYYNEIVVIKYGGNAMINDELKSQVMEDIVLLSLIGVKVVLVHGGGPELNATLAKLGKKSEFIDGLRVTDKETVEVAQMVLGGKINKDLVSLLHMQGGNAVGISGIDGGLIKAVKKNEQLGYVGRIEGVDINPVNDLLNQGYIPVISSLGCDADGNIYNINADNAAAHIAGALKAKSLIEMTDIAGIMKDVSDPDSLIYEVTTSEAEKFIEDGIVSGGMIPKVRCCIDAINLGTQKVIIMDGRVPHAILIEMLTDEGAGTMVVGDK